MPAYDFTTGEVLTAALVDGYLNNSYYAQMRQTSAQSLSTGAFTAITFTTEDFDSDSGHDTGSNTSRYTAQTAGKYLVQGKVTFAADINGSRYVQLKKNGSAVNGSGMRAPTSSVYVSVATSLTIVDLAVSDYVELHGMQNSGGSINTDVTGDVQSLLTVIRLSS